MKIIKEVMIGLMLILVVGGANASTSPRRIDLSKFRAVNTYINAVVHGKLNNVKEVIDDDAFFNIQHGNKYNTVNKPEVLYALSWTENMEQKCKYSKSIVWEDAGMSILKLNMKYADFTRTDIVTLQRAGAEWKITKVETSFK